MKKDFSSNQIRILCAKCGCYYYYDVYYKHKEYSKAVWLKPEDVDKCCPECNSQKIASQAHHSAGTFNCELTLQYILPKYFIGKGSVLEPMKARNILTNNYI